MSKKTATQLPLPGSKETSLRATIPLEKTPPVTSTREDQALQMLGEIERLLMAHTENMQAFVEAAADFRTHTLQKIPKGADPNAFPSPKDDFKDYVKPLDEARMRITRFLTFGQF